MRNVRMCFSRKLVLLCSLLLALCSFELHAQSEEVRSIQRLAWTRDEYASRYEVVIEKEEEGEYREHLREFTTELFIEVSLLPGKYRCRVITYDYLNLAGESSEWRYIEVLGLKPEQDDTLPELFLSDTAPGSSLDIADDTESVLLAAVRPDLYLSVSWMPSFTVSDKENLFFKQNMSLLGAAARFGVVWDTGNYFNPGLELAASYSFFAAGSGRTAAHLLSFGLNLFAQKWLSGNKMALTFRLGAGYSFLLPKGGAAYTNMGVSFLLFIPYYIEHLYLETGLDYAYWFTNPASSCFRPWLGVGWRF